MESEESTTGLSTAALVAIACNTFVAILLLLLCLIIYRACRVPSSPERLPVLAPREAQTQQMNEHKHLLTS
uniref:Adropin n=1 Tax=Stegastes partitus TaxID=144197 RepID=A0A3B5AVQ4_9TELE